MSQTVNGENTEKGAENTPKPVQRNYRPGQRQQERLQRIARRQKRRRIIGGIIAAILVIAVAILGDVEFNNYSAAQALATSHAQATAAVHATATSVFHANATATVTSRDCFVVPGAPALPSIYTASATPTAGPKTAPEASGTVVTQTDGLKYVDLKVGTGAEAKTGSNVTANYTGWLAATCQEFDSSYDSHTDQSGNAQPPAPATFQLAQGSVIQGWVEGVAGMKVGGIRRIFIPAALGYGATGSSPAIPANADLVFDVQLVAVA